MRVIREERDRILVECAFCHGTGKDPFGVMSWLSGSGRISIREEEVSYESNEDICPSGQ